MIDLDAEQPPDWFVVLVFGCVAFALLLVQWGLMALSVWLHNHGWWLAGLIVGLIGVAWSIGMIVLWVLYAWRLFRRGKP